jgi:hypothetical protein
MQLLCIAKKRKVPTVCQGRREQKNSGRVAEEPTFRTLTVTIGNYLNKSMKEE